MAFFGRVEFRIIWNTQSETLLSTIYFLKNQTIFSRFKLLLEECQTLTTTTDSCEIFGPRLYAYNNRGTINLMSVRYYYKHFKYLKIVRCSLHKQ